MEVAGGCWWIFHGDDAKANGRFSASPTKRNRRQVWKYLAHVAKNTPKKCPETGL